MRHEAADHVGGEDPVKSIDRHLVDAHLALENSGVVDQCGDAAEGVVHLREDAHDIGLDTRVAGDRDRLSALACDLADDDVGALFREMREMRYLWRNSLRMDNARLETVLGREPHTPLDVAVEAALEGLGCLTVETSSPNGSGSTAPLAKR